MSAAKNLELKAHGDVGLQNFPPSSNGRRFLAAVIDAVISGLAMQILTSLLSSVFKHQALLDWTVIFLITLFYYVVPTVIYGYTAGKKLMGIKVVNKNFDSDLGFMQILFRETLGKWFLFLGYFWILITADRKAWHDMAFRTRVIEFKN